MNSTEWDKEHARLTAALQALGKRPEGESVEHGDFVITYDKGYVLSTRNPKGSWRYSSVRHVAAALIDPNDATLTALIALNPDSEVAQLRTQVDVLSRNWDATRRELDNFKALLVDSNLRVRGHSRACREAEVEVGTLRVRVQELEGQVVKEKAATADAYNNGYERGREVGTTAYGEGFTAGCEESSRRIDTLEAVVDAAMSGDHARLTAALQELGEPGKKTIDKGDALWCSTHGHWYSNEIKDYCCMECIDTLRTELDARVIAHNELFDQLQRTTAELDAIKAQKPWRWSVTGKNSGLNVVVKDASDYSDQLWDKHPLYRHPVAEARDAGGYKLDAERYRKLRPHLYVDGVRKGPNGPLARIWIGLGYISIPTTEDGNVDTIIDAMPSEAEARAFDPIITPIIPGEKSDV